jgi:chemotaxis signal transduction protein
LAHHDRIDWQAARARLDAAQAALLAIDEPSDETLRDVLHARAVALAVPRAVAAAVEIVELIVFRLGGLRYAIGARDALESITIAEMTALPGVPNFYRGLISHRGLIYPLVDIRPLLGETVDDGAAPAQAILFSSDSCAAALAADTVEGFVRIDAATIVAGSGDDAEQNAAIRGVTADAIVVLDVWLLLADARLVLDDRSFSG